MRLRYFLPALLIGAGLLLPVQPAALAKTSYKQPKFKKFKAKKFKAGKRTKAHKIPKRKVVKHR